MVFGCGPAAGAHRQAVRHPLEDADHWVSATVESNVHDVLCMRHVLCMRYMLGVACRVLAASGASSARNAPALAFLLSAPSRAASD